MAQSLASVAEPPLPNRISLPPRCDAFAAWPARRRRSLRMSRATRARRIGIVLHLHWMEPATSPPHRSVLCFSRPRNGYRNPLADVVAQFTMLEENVHRLPQRVVEHLDDFLVNERIVGRAVDGVRTSRAGERKVMAPRERGRSSSGPYLGIAFGRAESHHDVFGTQDGLEPGTERAWRDPAPEARACPRSRDERIPPRRAGHRSHKGRGRRRANARPRRKRSDISRQASARRRPRAKELLAKLLRCRSSLFNCSGAIRLAAGRRRIRSYPSPSKCAAEDRRPACPPRACRRIAS